MPVKMEPASKIIVNLGFGANGKALAYLTNRVYAHMDKYVPMDTRDLRTIVFIKPGEIHYQTPYATTQYKGVGKNGRKFKHYTTPGTGPKWDEKLVGNEMNKIISEVKIYMGLKK